MSIDFSIPGQIVKAARALACITGKDFAKLAKCTNATLAHFETGRFKEPNRRIVLSIYKAIIELELDFVFEREKIVGVKYRTNAIARRYHKKHAAALQSKMQKRNPISDDG